jgi:glycine hydroxymethyltransferase
MKTILFLCTGNICRSPMAEGLFRHAVQGRGDFRMLSAGIGAMDGQPPTHYSVQAMRELGIDISGQRSRQLTAELVRRRIYFWHDARPCGHDWLLYPPAAEKTFLLREFDETLEPYEKDISDPIGSAYRSLCGLPRPDRAGHRHAFEIYGTTQLFGTRATQTPAVANFALGADHGGFELKEGSSNTCSNAA